MDPPALRDYLCPLAPSKRFLGTCMCLYTLHDYIYNRVCIHSPFGPCGYRSHGHKYLHLRICLSSVRFVDRFLTSVEIRFHAALELTRFRPGRIFQGEVSTERE